MKKVLLFFALMLAMAAQADVLGEYSFVGSLGDKIPVRLKFAVNGDEIAVGEIFYPKAKNPALPWVRSSIPRRRTLRLS